MQIKDFAMAQLPIFDRPKKQDLTAIKAKVEKEAEKEVKLLTDFSKTSFMKLNVDLATPILLVPLNDQSDEMLRMDFGHISVKNGYRHGEISKNERISKKISYQFFDVTLTKLNSVCCKKHFIEDTNMNIMADLALMDTQSVTNVPSLFLSVETLQKIVINISSKQYDFVMDMISPSNNFGYDDIDYTEVDEQEVISLREKYVEKIKAMQAQLAALHENDSETADLVSVSSYKTSNGPETDDLDFMKTAIEVRFQGLDINIYGSRNQKKCPINEDKQKVRVNIGKMGLGMVLNDKSMTINGVFDGMNVKDFFNENYCRRFQDMVKTNGVFKVCIDKDQQQNMRINVIFAEQLLISLNIGTIFEVLKFVDHPTSKADEMLAAEREKKKAICEKKLYYQQHLDMQAENVENINIEELDCESKRIITSMRIIAKMPLMQIIVPENPTVQTSQYL